MKRRRRGLRLVSAWRIAAEPDGVRGRLSLIGVTKGGKQHEVTLSLGEGDVRRLFREATTLLKSQRDAYARQWNAAGELLKGAGS